MRSQVATWVKLCMWSVSPGLLARVVPDQHEQTFSIGILIGASPFTLAQPADVENPVLCASDVTDVPAGFVADPFMIRHREHWYMFFEVYNKVLRRGHVGLAVSADGRHWRYDRIVLKEAFHLAYPRVFAWRDVHWLVPDTPRQGVRLYRAVAFPHAWTCDRVLIDDPLLVDPTIFAYNGRWWLLAGSSNSPGQVETLRLFHAPDPTGPWVEHPKSPVVHGAPDRARPAGSVLAVGGRMFRLAQDCIPSYGSRVRAFEITRCSADDYQETEVGAAPMLAAGTASWNRDGMHHLDCHRQGDGEWIACVDGWRWT